MNCHPAGADDLPFILVRSRQLNSYMVGKVSWSREELFLHFNTPYRLTFLSHSKTFSWKAVTGLPEPQQNHATIMVRFAWECLIEVSKVTKKLECTLVSSAAYGVGW